MLLSRRRLLAATALALVPLGLSSGAESAPATVPPNAAAGTIQSFYDTLLAVMKEAKRLPFDERYRRLQPAILRTFDLGLMTRLAIGPDWARLTPDQQQRLTDAFTRYTISTYASRFDDYAGERFEVDPNVAQSANGVIVRTGLVQHDGERVALNYLMRDTGGWHVIDVFLSGTVSELATRRSEFLAVLQREGADGLLRMLERRVAELRTS